MILGVIIYLDGHKTIFITLQTYWAEQKLRKKEEELAKRAKQQKSLELDVDMDLDKQRGNLDT